ncbi:3-deoxy-7-phosphoheptulonate synthase [Desulfurispira natronophila]|uniref:Phospho-2-dehydro-3-deoxyheptonate aldolase n=1 Tax=Desulfurispira natronophila TaxID=682562 RepID=A0A7W8DGR8_9BACT|nr:3-deoxy-7-phosphoheptulonate synthase [Desulfurispira natronophila]MBB5021659.1 3-deoxy-7-phosphoheptulonate synthase [Desulfurispira natronophila]
MIRTNNLNVSRLTPIIAPADLKQVFPLSDEGAAFVTQSRQHIRNILNGKDNRLMAVVGPCSIHDPQAALDYARKLAKVAHELRDQILIVMRVYFEKPRTTIGWKGLINDPDLNGTHQISKGLGVARQLLCDITELELPVATEMLDPITPQYLSDMVCWGAIGARTTESQPHREMASGLSFPVGFKNGTDGSLQIAIDAMRSALHSHSFLGINHEGRTSIVQTTGNPWVHIVLRGGNERPNYHPEDISQTEELLNTAGLSRTVMVDCSHANSYKDHERQEEVLGSVIEQICNGNTSISGIMLESNLESGNQALAPCPSQLSYGVSITDKCIDWPTTERLLRQAHGELSRVGGRKTI